jgi:beta-glucanase (GH16 family)
VRRSERIDDRLNVPFQASKSPRRRFALRGALTRAGCGSGAASRRQRDRSAGSIGEPHEKESTMKKSLLSLALHSGAALAVSGVPIDAPEATAATAGTWELVWQDEFVGEQIDPRNWELESNCWGGGNQEQQCYTARLDRKRGANAFLADGLLHIVARREYRKGPATPEGTGRVMATLPYTSARLRTKHRREWTFGRFEIRAKLPRGQGSWPAIWMLPTDSPHGRWAASGEIDIMEAVNLGARSDAPGVADGTPETRVHGTLHYGRVAPGNVHSGTFHRLPDDASPADDFHVYALEWEEGEIRWYVDGTHYATQRAMHWWSQHEVDGSWIDAPRDAPFDRNSRYHLLLNLAVGGNWAGKVNEQGIDRKAYPQTFLIDYVRIYRCSVGRADGRGCATVGANARLVRPKAGDERPELAPRSIKP